jgi:hypothetical protein
VLGELGLRPLRPARNREPERAVASLFRPLRQLVESVTQTFKGQLDLERHGGRTAVGVAVRVLQRIVALTVAIWHNDKTRRPETDQRLEIDARLGSGSHPSRASRKRSRSAPHPGCNPRNSTSLTSSSGSI